MTPLQEDTRFRVLRALQDNPRLTQRELSERLGVSLGATNFVLRALMEKGAIKIRNFRGNTRKLSYAYILTPQGLAEKASLTARFLARKQKEYESLKAEIEAVSRELAQDAPLVIGTEKSTDPLSGSSPAQSAAPLVGLRGPL
jgi:EPS-associated MarR family transcriptional regulator